MCCAWWEKVRTTIIVVIMGDLADLGRIATNLVVVGSVALESAESTTIIVVIEAI